MKNIIFITFVLLSLVASGYAEGLPPGKYFFSAPAFSSSRITTSKGNVREWYSEIIKIKDGTNNYRLNILELNRRGVSFDFTLSDSGVIKIIGSRNLSHGYYSESASGSGSALGEGLAKGKIRINHTSVVIVDISYRTSEWFIRPATQEEIDTNLKNGLKSVVSLLSGIGKSINKENIIKHLGGGSGQGYSGSDILNIEEKLKSGQIEYKDREFIIHRNAKLTEVEPARPDISPKFHRIYFLPFIFAFFVITIGFILYIGLRFFKKPQ
jgi:hypothetical protein